MKFTLSWLKDYLETDAAVAEIGEKLTAIGLEVEEIHDPAAALAPFTVAYVEEAVQHPDADRLQVCTVNTGDELVQVVCGAPNARAGMKGVFARSGTTIPGTGVKLKKSKIRGVESNGMLCSEREMGMSEEHDGIIDLPADAPVGAPFAAVIGQDDPMIHIAITPNRADCLGVSGIARDLAAAGLGTLKSLAVEPVAGTFPSPIGVRFDFADDKGDACPLFLARYVRGVKNGPSPQWLQERLKAIGLRPISALVDMTNYLTFDRNRPVHAFDADRIKGDHLWLKLGCGGQSFEALNEKSYTLDDDMTAIGDESGIVSLAGVMGGEASGCGDETTNVFLEVALFDPVRTATTGRRLGLESDARYRFERGLDPAFARDGLEAATRMVQDLCGGEASEVVVAGEVPSWHREITFRPSRVHSLGGIDLDAVESVRILHDLGFACDEVGSDHVAVLPPSWRGDIVGEPDLVEEVLRVHGYDNIPAVSLPRHSVRTSAGLDITQRRAGWARRALAARGLMEAVTYSFMSATVADQFGGVVDALRLANPISADLDAMRPSILPNLIDAAARNADRGFADIGLFEVGPQFEGDKPDEQRHVASGLRAGSAAPRNWQSASRSVDVFDAKADALAALEAAGAPVASLQVSTDAPGWYHPGRSGAFKLGPKVLGWFGEIHPGVLTSLDVAGPAVGFEVFIDSIPVAKRKAARTRPALKTSDFQAVERDFAFVVEEAVAADQLVRAAQSVDKKLITAVAVFDLYAGKGIDVGHKSVAIAVRLQPTDGTLTDEDIEAVATKVVENVTRQTGGKLRG